MASPFKLAQVSTTPHKIQKVLTIELPGILTQHEGPLDLGTILLKYA